MRTMDIKNNYTMPAFNPAFKKKKEEIKSHVSHYNQPANPYQV